MAGVGGSLPRSQEPKWWPTAKAFRALGYQLPDSITDDEVVDLVDITGVAS